MFNSSFSKTRLLYINVGHFVDHLFMLIFAKAAFSAGLSFGMARDGAYAEMIPYGIPALVLFGACAPIAAHLADIWSRNGMIAVFFIGIGVASIIASFAASPLQLGISLSILENLNISSWFTKVNATPVVEARAVRPTLCT